MTSLDLLAVIREIQPKVANSHIVNVYQAATNLLILKLRTTEAESLQLLLEAAKRIHLTNTRLKTPRLPSAFCVTLRKHLRNGILTNISQRDLDRLTILDIKNGSVSYKLFVELLDRGNVLLTDSMLTIIAANVRNVKTSRPISKGSTYSFPQLRGLDLQEATSVEAFDLIKKSKSDTVRSLVQFLNLPGEVAEEICLRANIGKGTPASNLTIVEVESLLEQARLLVKEIQDEPLQPVMVRNSATLLSVVPRRFLLYRGSENAEFKNFSDALEQYYREVNLISRGQRENEAMEKWEHVIASQTESAAQLVQEAKKHRERGALIFAHLRELEQLLAPLKEAKREQGDWRTASETIRGTSNGERLQLELVDPKSGRISVTIAGTSVKLDANKNAAANASEYFENAKEAEGKARRAIEAVEETRRKLAATADEVVRERVEEKKTLARQFWYERFRWFISSEGCLVVGGRDASQNDSLVKKYLEPADIVVHADVHGAPFVIIKVDKGTLGEPTIEEAAQFAVSYSSAWKGGLGSTDAYWVKPEQISKSAPSGEYIGKGAFMIRGEKNIYRGIPLRLSIGVQEQEGTPRLIGGPERAIRTHTQVLVNIIPGDNPPEKFAGQLRYRLAQLLSGDVANELKHLDDSEFIRFLPQGGSRLAG